MHLSVVVVTTFWVLLAMFSLAGSARLEHVWGWAKRRAPHADPPVRWPRVTLQLPVYNERDVVRRLLVACGRLNYPAGRLAIQVLDDSTDDTSSVVAEVVPGLRAKGIDVAHIQRVHREGFKAGALGEGLRQATGDIIAVLDADFIPEPDFLISAVPHLGGSVGMVQTRWTYVNEREGWLTRAQAILLDGHFVVEQTARHRLGRWFNFNGTAGIWAREAIEQAGGWSGDTLTEDLDLSYRAQLQGFAFTYLVDQTVPCELPSTMSAFKVQQHRWAKGSTQTLRKLWASIWRSSAPFHVKREAAMHLSGHLFHPMSVLLAMVLPPAIWVQHRHPSMTGGWEVWVLALAWLPFAVTYGLAGWHGVSRGRWERLAMVPLALSLGLGLGVAQSRAVWEGLSGQVGTFERTPKAGRKKRSSYAPGTASIDLLEVGMAIYLCGALGAVTALGAWWGMPFLILYAVGYSWVAVSGLWKAQ